MCESGLSGWMVRACFQAAMASGVFSAFTSRDSRVSRGIIEAYLGKGDDQIRE